MLASLLLAVTAQSFGTTTAPAAAPQPIVVAIAGWVERPATYRVDAGSTAGDLAQIAAAETSELSIVRRGMQYSGVTAAQPLEHGDTLLVSPSYQGETRHLVLTTRSRLPLVVALPTTEARVDRLGQLLGVSGDDGTMRVAPIALSDGSLADGTAVMLPPCEASDRAYNMQQSLCVILDATGRGTTPPAMTAQATPPQSTPPRRPMIHPGASGHSLPTQTVSLSTPAPQTAAPVQTPLPAGGPNTPAAITPSDAIAAPVAGGAVTPPRDIDARHGGQPTHINVPAFPVHGPVAHPQASQPTYPAADREAMSPEGPGSVDLSKEQPLTLAQMAAGPLKTIRPQAGAIIPVAGVQAAAAPRSLAIGAARPIDGGAMTAGSLGARDSVIQPSASRLGGVMFAAIVLVVTCGGLVLWSQSGKTLTQPAPALAAEMPITAAPITEEPATQVPPALLHGAVVGLDKLRVDAAHPISPPHYAKQAAPARQPATAGESAAAGGAPVSGPRYAARAASSRQTVSVGEGEPRPADLLARALQAMKREERA